MNIKSEYLRSYRHLARAPMLLQGRPPVKEANGNKEATKVARRSGGAMGMRCITATASTVMREGVP